MSVRFSEQKVNMLSYLNENEIENAKEGMKEVERLTREIHCLLKT